MPASAGRRGVGGDGEIEVTPALRAYIRWLAAKGSAEWVIAFAVQEGFPTSDFKAGYEAAIADMTAAQAAAAREDGDA